MRWVNERFGIADPELFGSAIFRLSKPCRLSVSGSIRKTWKGEMKAERSLVDGKHNC